MKALIKLISIANRLDQKGLRKEADQLDRVIRKMAQSWPHDDADMDDADMDMDFEKYESPFAGFDDETDIEEPSDEELMAMEQGLDPFEADDLEDLRARLQTLTDEMQIFTESLLEGSLDAEDFAVFDDIKNEFIEVTKMIKAKEAELVDSSIGDA